MASGTDGPFQGGKEPHPPSWDGSDPGNEMPVYEKNVKLWEFESELEAKKRGVRLLRNLTGVARSIADTLEFEEVACEDGVKNLLKTLRAHFEPHMEISLPRAFERAVYGPQRNHKEGMQEYIIRCEKAFHLLEKESLKLPDVAAGYIVYRQAALSEAQELKFSTWSRGKYDLKTVVSCLRKLDKVIPEHKSKGASAFLVGDEAEGQDEEHYEIEEYDVLEDENGIYVEFEDEEKIWEEDEAQLALATYQEVRKAINAQQKGRQYYGKGGSGKGGKGKGAKRGSDGSFDYYKNRKRISVEELKLRTKCGRCGLVGHWAKECRNPPDHRGRQFAANSHGSSGSVPSSAGVSSSSKAASHAGGPSQQSWYVEVSNAAGSFDSKEEVLFEECYGVNASKESLGSYESIGHDRCGVSDQVEHSCDDVSAGLEVSCDGIAVFHAAVHYFVGLTTNPTYAVVDTAAQDGLIGNAALERLKGSLAERGLRVAWTSKQAKAHGVGGQAKVLGIVALPLGLAGTTGILEVTVVEGEVPLLLPIKLLRHLKAVIDLQHFSIQFHDLSRTVALSSLPSGHIAIEVLDFGPDGFSLPSSAQQNGYTDVDFRLPLCPKSSTSKEMPNSLVSSVGSLIALSLAHGAAAGSLPPHTASAGASFWRCNGDWRRWKEGEPQEGYRALETASGQGVPSSTASWIGGVGAIVDAYCGGGRWGSEAIFSAFARAAERVHHQRRAYGSFEEQDGTSEIEERVFASYEQIDERRQPIRGLGDVSRLSLTMESSGTSEPWREQEEEGGGESLELSSGHLRQGEVDAGVEEQILGADGATASHAAVGGRAKEVCRGASNSKSSARGSSEGACGERNASGADDGAGARRDPRSDDGRVCDDGSGKGLHGAQGLSPRRDVGLCGEEVEVRARDERTSGTSGGMQSNSGGDESKCECNSISSPWTAESEEAKQVEVTRTSSSGTWVQLSRGDKLEEFLQRFEAGGPFEISEVMLHVGEVWYEATVGELLPGDQCLLKIDQSEKGRCEEFCEDVEETALPKKVKSKLRAAMKEGSVQEVFPVGISEVYSPPRIAEVARRKKVSTGGSYDLHTGYDLRLERDLKKMWKELRSDEPELAICSPPCTPFSLLQELNFPKMEEELVMELVGEGLHHWSVATKVCMWQHRRGALFLLEHPKTSKAWQEEDVKKLMEMEGVYTCHTDMCAYGLKVGGGPNLKPTTWLTNSKEIAEELQRRCSKDHEHVSLIGGKAREAAIYPRGLCEAVVRGFRNYLKQKYGKVVEKPKEAMELFEVFAEDDLEDDLDREVEAAGGGAPRQPDGDIAEDLEDEEGGREEQEAEKKEAATVGEAAPSKEEVAKIYKLHNNLGHPELSSFLRFLRAGRVREDVLRWVRKNFRCATCESLKVPKAPRPAVVPRCYAPGVAVGIDLFFIPDINNQRSLPILNVVDLGTNYQMVEMLDSREPLHIWRTFWKVWARTFGVPQFVAIDEVREFRGGFSRLCAGAGTVVFRAAARAPWQQGKVERHGGIIKEMIERSREEMPPTSQEDLVHILHACESAKNRYSNRSGYSPTQRMIGQWPRVPSSLMSDEDVDPSLQAQNCTEEFERLMEMRRIAQDAFMKVASHQAAARALKARPRLQRGFQAGDLVYVFRSLRKRKTVRGHQQAQRGSGLGRKATWIGPGSVLAMEGSIVWVNMFGELWRAAVEQVRMATSTEKLGLEVIAEQCQEMQERLKRSSHRAGYRDITGEELPEMGDDEEGANRDEDEVRREGEARGLPRPRIRFEEEAEDPVRQEEEEDEMVYRGRGLEEERRASIHSVVEPEREETPAESQVDEEELTQSIQSVIANEQIDGGRPTYDAVRDRVMGRWRQNTETPYFAEFSVFFEEGDFKKKEEEKEEDEPKKDYWVFDTHRQVLQRHHVVWRKAFFNPTKVEGSPVPLRAIRKKRTTKQIRGHGEVECVVDEWSLFTAREEKRQDWWRGITEFDIDAHYLNKPGEAGKPKMKRGEGEVFPHEISAEEWPKWQIEDKEEFDKVTKSGALKILSVRESEEVRRRLQREGALNRILPSRMVRRYKPGDKPGAPRSRKSRFCIRGDRDPDAVFLSRFAPTVTTSNLQVLIQAAVNRGFKGRVGDLKSAFTQSQPLVREAGSLYCKASHGSMPGLEEGQLCEIVLGCYGLVDAPLNWRKTLVSYVTQELNYKQSVLDPCTFVLHSKDGLEGVLAVEVDDLLMFGGSEHSKRMEQLQKRFTFGKIEEIDEKGVNFNGRRIRQVEGDVLIDMKAFVEERLQPVSIEGERAKQKEEPITEEERGKVRSTCGALNWAGREGRPDAAAAASLFSSQILEMKVSDILELNKVVSQLKKDSGLALRIQPLAEEKLQWGVISDSSFANARGGKTQAGHMLIAFEKGLLEGERSKTNILHWRSGKLHRTVGSTLAAETQSLARGVGDLLWMMMVYMELVNPRFQLRDWRRYIGQQGYTAFSKHNEVEELRDALALVDAKSLYDLLINETTGGSDRRTALDIQVLREELQELQGKIRWVEHMEMPADCLTKRSGRADALRRILDDGVFGITEEAAALSARLDTRKKVGYNRR